MPATIKKLLVVRKQQLGDMYKKLFLQDENWTVTSPGGAICGQHFDLIVFTHGWDDNVELNVAKTWAEHTIFCRVRDKKESCIIIGWQYLSDEYKTL